MTHIPEDHRDLTYLSLEEAQTPRDGALVMVDRWWSCHPEKGLIFWRRYSPQCNTNERINKKLTAQLYPWAEAQFMHVVYVPYRHQTPPDR